VIPVIALIGRPNVGKSTLFNVLTRSRDAIVANEPGLTRDRQYGVGDRNGKTFIVVDTGGLSGEKQDLDELMARQTLHAMEEADEILFLVDAKDGLTSGDRVIADLVRKSGKSCQVVVNKVDGSDPEQVKAEFYALGFEHLRLISAAHRKGTGVLVDQLLASFPEQQEPAEEADHGPLIAVIGRPNVGKSTLINRLAGEERVVAFDQPGTTRDTISVPFERHGKPYTLIDTAGVRKKNKIEDDIEYFAYLRATSAIERADVVLFMVDADFHAFGDGAAAVDDGLVNARVAADIDLGQDHAVGNFGIGVHVHVGKHQRMPDQRTGDDAAAGNHGVDGLPAAVVAVGPARAAICSSK